MSTDKKSNIIYEVETRIVSFPSNGIRIAGILHIPKDLYSVENPGPAIVFGHQGSAVKEQAPAIYARLLSEKGFIMLTFDAAYQGESEGIPRGLEDPAQRTEDFKAAISYLNSIDFVDSERTALAGICASGGYVIAAAASDHRVKAVATVAAIGIGHFFRDGVDGNQAPSVVQSLLAKAGEARTVEAKGGAPAYFPLFPKTEKEAKASGQYGYEGWQYYCTPLGEHPRSAKAFAWKSVDLIAGFDAFRFVDMISPRPLLMVYGPKSPTQWMAKVAFDAAKEPKELYAVEGSTKSQLYYDLKYVTRAVEKLDEFFRKNL